MALIWLRSGSAIVGIAMAGLFSAALYAAEKPLASSNYKLTPQSVTPLFTLPAVAAEVDGAPIPTENLWRALLKAHGNEVLSDLVDDALIQQEFRRGFGEEPARGGKDKKKKVNRKWKEFDEEVEGRIQMYKDQFANEATLTQQLADMGLTPESFNDQIRRQVMREALMGDRLKITSKEVKAYFEANRRAFALPERVHLKMITVATEQEAKDIVAALNAGADFSLLARQKSLVYRDEGGDLGVVARGTTGMDPALEAKVFSLKKGEVASFLGPLGKFNVIKMEDKMPAKQPVLDEATWRRIVRILSLEKFKQVYPVYIQELRSRAKIRVFVNP